jgi:hypothetical protein
LTTRRKWGAAADAGAAVDEEIEDMEAELDVASETAFADGGLADVGRFRAAGVMGDVDDAEILDDRLAAWADVVAESGGCIGVVTLGLLTRGVR